MYKLETIQPASPQPCEDSWTGAMCN